MIVLVIYATAAMSVQSFAADYGLITARKVQPLLFLVQSCATRDDGAVAPLLASRRTASASVPGRSVTLLLVSPKRLSHRSRRQRCTSTHRRWAVPRMPTQREVAPKWCSRILALANARTRSHRGSYRAGPKLPFGSPRERLAPENTERKQGTGPELGLLWQDCGRVAPFDCSYVYMYSLSCLDDVPGFSGAAQILVVSADCSQQRSRTLGRRRERRS
jgi:hypothetical protein